MVETQHEHFMREVIALARRNVSDGGGGPFAALIVKDGTVIARGVNRVTSTNDPTAHAEIVTIREACRALGSFQLEGCDVYTSCEPCPMCLGAIYWARPRTVYYGATRDDATAIGFDDRFIYDEFIRHHEARRIPHIQVLHDEALSAFHDWQESKNKIPY